MVLRKLTKEQAKEEVKKLVDKYVRIVESGSIKRYKEEDTKAEFIEPLFEALGWDVRNTENDDEVVREEKISKGRVDYSFRINGIPKFFLEAKALKEDLDNIKFVEQAVNYSWHKGCTWAVLTDFEAIKIFNAEWKSANPLQAQFGQTLPCQLFLEKFDTLWLLSRESFEKKLLDIEAEKWGKKIKKTAVDKQLLSDLTRFRDLLNKNILKNNSSKNISGDELDEAVQRIIDRLIFIRTLEDKELEAPMLQSVIREDLNKRIYKKLNLIFRKIDDIYNSKLFTPHLCEDLDVDDEVLSKIIGGLFATTDNTVRYDFSAIDADVLGNIYEQYLGHILKKTDKRAKLAEGKAHRKEQGIYYTPTYVVDYIVKNTVGELAKDKKFDLKNVKILDPACGSGSFLMKAFDYLVTLDKKKNGEVDQTKLDLTGAGASYGRKVEILKNNIFGVDLDPKAVEIAQLNLLLKAAEKKHRLPTLQENIKVGNSLIDDSAIAGNRAFKWEEQFKDIIADGGFDVVIGNPPYVEARQIGQKYVDFYRGNFKTAGNRINTFSLFIEKSISLLSEHGLFGMIVHKNSIRSNDYIKLRQFVLDNCKILKILPIGAGVFEGVTGEMVILIFQKDSNMKERLKNIVFHGGKDSMSNKTSYQKLSQRIFYEIPGNRFNVYLNETKIKILEKIKSESIELKEIAYTKQGIIVGDEEKYVKKTKESEKYKPVLRGRNISRYNITFGNEYLFYVPGTAVLKRGKTPDLFEKPEKILTQHVSGRIIAALDCDEYYALQTINLIFSKGKISNKYLLALLNSKLINFYYDSYFNMGSEFTTAVATENLDLLPIKQIPEKQQPIIKLADKMISLNKNLNGLKDKQTDEKARLEKEIQKLDSEIDEEVYKLYGITEEEKKIIEESLK
ncbi:MAG TPA: N-6 DNA methylase [Candidatus Nanoarchaeia archaeon]|nr:N-6 DNA methylase [Candidatus Nanoarchaeia archaeon]